MVESKQRPAKFFILTHEIMCYCPLVFERHHHHEIMCDIMYSKCELALMRQHHEIICESSIFELVSIRNHHEKVIVRDSLTRFWRATYDLNG